MILNLRGCSGAGKSYPGFRLLNEFGPPVEELRTLKYFPNRKTGKPRRKPKLIGQVLPGGLCLAGRYTLGKSTRTGGVGYSGGLDGYFPMDEMQEMVEELCDRFPHVYMESLMISGTQQRWIDFAREHGGYDGMVFATLDTPIELCIERVLQRNGGRPVKEDQIAKHRNQVLRCATRFHEEGLRSFMIDHTQSYEQVRQLLFDGGWDPRGAVA